MDTLPDHHGGHDPMTNLQWTAARTLLAAQNRTTKALELYLLAQYLDQHHAHDELVTTLEAAIEDHERIIEDLEQALQALD